MTQIEMAIRILFFQVTAPSEAKVKQKQEKMVYFVVSFPFFSIFFYLSRVCVSFGSVHILKWTNKIKYIWIEKVERIKWIRTTNEWNKKKKQTANNWIELKCILMYVNEMIERKLCVCVCSYFDIRMRTFVYTTSI